MSASESSVGLGILYTWAILQDSQKYQVPELKLSTSLVVKQFDSSICPDIGYSYTYSLNLNLDHH
jgi:hypothetical protein